MNLDDERAVRAFDSQNFLHDVDTLPDQVAQAWELAQSYALPDGFQATRHIVLAGMGSSAIGGALVHAHVAEVCPVPITILRDYSLPAFVGADTLVIASSHSGETEETLAAAQSTVERGARLLAITRGGELAALAETHGQPVWRFEHAGQPRSAVGFSFMLTLGALVKLGLLPDPSADIAGAVAALRTQQKHLQAEVPVTRNPAKRMAGQCLDRLPLIFGAGRLAPVARRWKSQINEVVKAVSVFDELPELDHNSVAGTLYPEALVSKFIALFLRSGLEHPRYARRAAATREIYMIAGFNTDEIAASGPSPLAHLFTSLHFGDYTAFYLALAYGVDPSPVPQIDYLKEQLQQP
jgi:glucose/mannose-6-phosphate isomerase